MRYQKSLKRFNLLTFPKIVFSLLFLLIATGYFLKLGLADFIKYHWSDTLVTLVAIFFALKTSFQHSAFQENNPLTTLLLLLLSLYFVYIDLRLIYALISLDLTAFDRIYTSVWIGGLFILPVLVIGYLVDRAIN